MNSLTQLLSMKRGYKQNLAVNLCTIEQALEQLCYFMALKYKHVTNYNANNLGCPMNLFSVQGDSM